MDYGFDEPWDVTIGRNDIGAPRRAGTIVTHSHVLLHRPCFMGSTVHSRCHQVSLNFRLNPIWEPTCVRDDICTSVILELSWEDGQEGNKYPCRGMKVEGGGRLLRYLKNPHGLAERL